jgi:hypothetical protein
MFSNDETDEQIRFLLGENARRSGGWAFIQDTADPGLVGFVGAAKLPGVQQHPFRYGSQRSHVLVHGEVIFRPHLVVATDTLRGQGLGGLATANLNIESMLSDGEILFDHRR